MPFQMVLGPLVRYGSVLPPVSAVSSAVSAAALKGSFSAAPPETFGLSFTGFLSASSRILRRVPLGWPADPGSYVSSLSRNFCSILSSVALMSARSSSESGSGFFSDAGGFLSSARRRCLEGRSALA